jgi:hypothetical protein
MRSVACTGGVQAGTETGVFGTSVEDGDEDCEVVPEDEPLEPHAAANKSSDEARTTPASLTRVEPKTSDTMT